LEDSVPWKIMWKKKECDKTLKATIPNIYYDRSKISEECGILQIFG
jgi:hypothetical protein